METYLDSGGLLGADMHPHGRCIVRIYVKKIFSLSQKR